MNDRIKELIAECITVSRFSYESHGGGYNTEHFNKEKFAELIVQECMNQVREQYLPVLEDENMMKDAIWKSYVGSGVDSVFAIKEHFGIER